MTNKQRHYAVMEGAPADRMPVTSLYSELYYCDHFAEITGLPQWETARWLVSSPEEHLAIYKRLFEAAPIETLRPCWAPPRDVRENTTFFEQDGEVYRRYHDSVECVSKPSASGHASDYHANERQRIFNSADIRREVHILPAESSIAAGVNDYIEAVVAELGDEHFILTGGEVGTLWGCTGYLGQANTYRMLIEQPDLIHELSRRLLEQSIEGIRVKAAAGGDAIYIDDATATSDMISLEHYEKFCLPYITEMVREIQRHDHKAILIYFGGVMDRLDAIASTGADALAMEASMKNYVNDIEQIVERIGGRMVLFGNIDPVGVLEDGTAAELDAEIRRQAAAGRKGRGFLISTGSPITPGTPLARVQRYIKRGQDLGASN